MMQRLSSFLKLLITAGTQYASDMNMPISRVLRKYVFDGRGRIALAKLLGKSFYCDSLRGGEVSWGAFISSDMSVSCTCFDYDASAKIGNLKAQTLQEIFSGAIAEKFRRDLAARRYPTNLCRKCYGLRWAASDKAIAYAAEHAPPTSMIGMENNVTCNLRCCNWADVANTRHQARLTLEDVRKVAATIKEHRIKKVLLYNWGEPFLSPTVYEQFAVLRKENPDVWFEISTNGMLLNSDSKRDAALLLNHILFSIHGSSQESVARYMIGGNFEKAYNNMTELAEYRYKNNQELPIIEWKYIVFNWNDSEELISRAVNLAKKAGIDFLSFWCTPFPPHGISWRYFLKSYFRKVGKYVSGNPGSGDRVLVDCRPPAGKAASLALK